MTLGELAEKLQALQDAEGEVQDAMRSIGFGGNAETMKGKESVLEYREAYRDSLFNEEIIL